MYGLLNLKLILSVATSVAIFLSGWWVNGWRWEAKYQALKKEYADAVVKAEQDARRKEISLQLQANEEIRKKDAQIRAVNNTLERTLNELRNRPSRVPMPGTSGSPKGTTGADLSREDAQFLAREAARADQLIAALQYCYANYDRAREALQTTER